ncbi:MAG: major facilitator superfamily 1 [Polaromonas sp.]|nr:major facilitator superfamily 1 [Polaromonas sp.]
MQAAHTPVQPLPASTRRSIALLACATFASMTAQRICDAMLPELSRVFAVSLGQAAQVVSFFAMTYGASQMFYGPIGDRLGKFRIITLATVVASIGSLMAVLAGSLDTLVFARMLMAAGAAGLIPLAMAWVGDSVPNDQLQEMLTRTGLGTTLGLVVGQMIGGVLTDAFGWRWCFVFMTVLFAAVALLLHRDMRRQGLALFRVPVAGATSAAPASVARHTAAPVARTSFLKQITGIAADPWSRTVLAIALVEGAAGFGVLAIWASHLHARLGLSLSLSGAIVALFGLGGVMYMAVGRRMISRFGQQGLVLVGGAIVGICAWVLAYTAHWAFAVPASLVAGFGFFMFHNTVQANATNMTPQARGTSVSLFASFLFLGQSVGVVMAASLIGQMGSSAVVAGGGLVMALEGLFFAWALRRRVHKPVRQPA